MSPFQIASGAKVPQTTPTGAGLVVAALLAATLDTPALALCADAFALCMGAPTR
jgi:hypothetical protein